MPRSLLFFLCASLLLLTAGGCHVPNAGTLPDLAGIKPAPAKPTVVYLPGWQSQREPEYAALVKERQEGEMNLLRRAFPGCDVIYVRWNNAVPWQECVDNVEDLILKLEQKLCALSDAQRKNLILVGHSLGGRSTVRILSSLSRKGMQIRRGVFLAAAIEDDSPHIALAINASLDPVINVYCLSDGTLRILLGLVDQAPPLGAYGNALPYPADRFLQYHVDPEYTEDTNWFNNHWSMFHLEVLGNVLTASEPPPNEIHAPEKALQIPNATTPSYKMDANLFFWKTLRSSNGWRLQQSSLLPFRYRIIDRRDMIRASGFPDEMQETFESIIRQLAE